jgi:hypothetical protein
VTERQTVLVPALPAGNYQVHKPRVANAAAGYTRNLVVHLDSRESDMGRVDSGQLAEWLGGPVEVIAPADTAALAPRGSEFWKLLVWALAAAYVVEAVVGHLQTARRERLRAAEAQA